MMLLKWDPSVFVILQLVTAPDFTVGERKCIPKLRSAPRLSCLKLLSVSHQQAWKRTCLDFFFLFLHTQSFSRVQCYLTNDRNLLQLCQLLGNELFFLFLIGWDNEAEISLCPDLELLQPLNFIAQQSICLCLWEGVRLLKFIWCWISKGICELAAHWLPRNMKPNRLGFLRESGTNGWK